MFSPGTPDLALRMVAFLAGGRPPGDRVFRTVLVDTSHSGASFFEYMGTGRQPSWQRFEEFYLSFARLGMMPLAGDIADINAARPASLVIVNPRGPLAGDETECMRDFVSGGGRLLVLDTIMNSGSIANEMVRSFGLGVVARPMAAMGGGPKTARARGVGRRPGLDPVLEIVGGETMLADSTGRVMVARAAYGAGEVLVAVDSYAYSEAGLGRPLQPASAYESCLPRYRALFHLLGRLR